MIAARCRTYFRRTALLVLGLGLAGCAGAPPPSPEQRAAAADDLNPSGRPYAGPPGIRSSYPPADTSDAPLYCHPEPPGTVCTRLAPAGAGF